MQLARRPKRYLRLAGWEGEMAATLATAVSLLPSGPQVSSSSPRGRRTAHPQRCTDRSLRLYCNFDGTRGDDVSGKRRAGVVFHSPPAGPESEWRQSDEKKEGKDESNRSLLNQDDVNYLWKLVAGSVGGAFIIKYGSVLFPDVTRPDLFHALVIILTPVLASVILLTKVSSSRNPS